MNQKALSALIGVLTLATAGIHWYLVPAQGLPAGIPFILNGLGYLALLAALWFKPGPLAGRGQLIHYAYLGFTAVTILAWVAIGDKSLTTPLGQIGWTDKAIEAVLMFALWQNLRLFAR